MRALVLAAGEGRRMGGPKALVDWGAVPLAVAHAHALTAAGARDVVVVLRGPVAEALAGRWSALPVTVVVSHEADAWGPAGSLRAAVGAVAPGGDVWAVTPVDAMPVRKATLGALCEAHRGMAGDGPRAARPVYGGRGGHPVVLDGAVLAAFGGEAALPTLREVLAALGDGVVRVKVDDPWVLADLDTPEDLARWRAVAVI